MNMLYDDAIVGAGVLGLAHAYQLAKRGRKVIVFERSEKAQGASVRNFGMIWPIGQPLGHCRELAITSRGPWFDILRASGIWHEAGGSLHLAYQDDEAEVLREFHQRAGIEIELVNPAEILERAPRVNPRGLKLGMFSRWETCVDPRQVIAELPGWLASTYGVRFEFSQTVIGYDDGTVRTPKDRWRVGRLWVCSGDDFQTLYPAAFAEHGLFRCKLQMMRAELPDPSERLGPMLAAGLTLRHYKAFEGCQTLQALRDRFARESPEFDRYGIHVMTSQNGRGEVVIGDSHEYGDDIEIFDKDRIDAIILDYLKTFFAAEFTIKTRWHGIYAKHATAPYVVIEPEERVKAINATGGSGMTLSHGLADHVVTATLGPLA